MWRVVDAEGVTWGWRFEEREHAEQLCRWLSNNRGPKPFTVEKRRVETMDLGQYMQIRDGLAWRVAQGERLSREEQRELATIDAMLDAMEPSSEILSPAVQEILREVREKSA